MRVPSESCVATFPREFFGLFFEHWEMAVKPAGKVDVPLSQTLYSSLSTSAVWASFASSYWDLCTTPTSSHGLPWTCFGACATTCVAIYDGGSLRKFCRTRRVTSYWGAPTGKYQPHYALDILRENIRTTCVSPVVHLFERSMLWLEDYGGRVIGITHRDKGCGDSDMRIYEILVDASNFLKVAEDTTNKRDMSLQTLNGKEYWREKVFFVMILTNAFMVSIIRELHGLRADMARQSCMNLMLLSSLATYYTVLLYA